MSHSQNVQIKESFRECDTSEAWQVAEIWKALKEADAGDFATDEEISKLDAKWTQNAREVVERGTKGR